MQFSQLLFIFHPPTWLLHSVSARNSMVHLPQPFARSRSQIFANTLHTLTKPRLRASANLTAMKMVRFAGDLSARPVQRIRMYVLYTQAQWRKQDILWSNWNLHGRLNRRRQTSTSHHQLWNVFLWALDKSSWNVFVYITIMCEHFAYYYYCRLCWAYHTIPIVSDGNFTCGTYTVSVHKHWVATDQNQLWCSLQLYFTSFLK